MTLSRTVAVATAALLLLVPERDAHAQGFNAETWPVGTLERFAVSFDTTEYLPQAFVTSRDAPARPLYSGSLKMHRKIIANRFVTSLQANFDPVIGVNLATNSFGSDTVQLGWGANLFGPAGELADTRTGFSALPLTLEASGFSLQERPAELILKTDNPRRAFFGLGRPTVGSGRGYRIASFDAGADAAAGGFPPQTIQPFDRVTGLLRTGDDSITVRLADPRRFSTLAWWLDPPTSAARNAVFAYARCGAAPTPRTFDRLYALMDQAPRSDGSRRPAKTLIDLPNCSGSWFITFRSLSSTTGNRAFHFHYSTPTVRNDVNVGIAWATTEAERQTIRQTLMRSAWMLYAMTGGEYQVRSFNVFNDANTCDDDAGDVWNASCHGRHCDVCFDDNDGRSGYRRGGQLILMKRGVMASPDVMVHEFGHWLLGLPDEYRDRDGCSPKSVGICMHSVMAATGVMQRRLCTDFDHLIQPTDQRMAVFGLATTLAPEPGCAFACDGARLCCDSPFGCDSSSATTRAVADDKLPLLHPQDRSVEGTDYVTIFAPGASTELDADWNNRNRGTLGRFNRLF